MPRRIAIYGSVPKWQPETIKYLNAISVSNDGTIYYSGDTEEITGEEVWLAIDDHYVGLKDILGLPLGVDNLKTLLSFVYPFFGGTSGTHKFNGIDARDLDAAYRGLFFGGVTHGKRGVTFNGTNSYMDTKMIALSKYVANYHFFGCCRENHTAGIIMGGQTTASGQDYEWAQNNGASLGNSFTTITGVLNGMNILYRVNATQFHYLTSAGDATLSQNFSANPNQSISIGCFSTVSPTLFADGTVKYAIDGSQITGLQAADIRTLALQLQIDLHRA